MNPFFTSLRMVFNSFGRLSRTMGRLMFIVISLFLLTACIAPAQPHRDKQDTRIVIVQGGENSLRWYGHANRTYFIQVSDPNNPLGKWHWLPAIESGNNEEISNIVGGTIAKAFYHLSYTGIIPALGETLEDADPAYVDSDNDGLSDAAEIHSHGTNPILADTDGDGMPDGLEITHSLNPLSAADATSDLDSDGISNGWEYLNGLNIALNDTNEDLDGDKLNNFLEYLTGTRANRFDTDGDMLPDGWEIQDGLNPLENFGGNGMDGDAEVIPEGVSNINELIHGCSPVLVDTVDDGTDDLQEIEQGSDPNDASDGGQSPPAEDIALVKLTVGDPSGSESERYNMIVKSLEGDTRTITHQAKEFGVVSTESYKLRKGAKYEVEIFHTGTTKGQTFCGHGAIGNEAER